MHWLVHELQLGMTSSNGRQINTHITILPSHSLTDCFIMALSRINPNCQNPMVVDKVYMMGKDMMNKGQQKLRNLGPGRSEDHQFREMFGLKAPAALDAWDRLLAHNLVPSEGMFFHLLWALMFMKIYAVEVGLYANMVGSDGTTEPKIF